MKKFVMVIVAVMAVVMLAGCETHDVVRTETQTKSETIITEKIDGELVEVETVTIENIEVENIW